MAYDAGVVTVDAIPVVRLTEEERDETVSLSWALVDVEGLDTSGEDRTAGDRSHDASPPRGRAAPPGDS